MNMPVFVYSEQFESNFTDGSDYATMLGTTISHESGHGYGLVHKQGFVNGSYSVEYSGVGQLGLRSWWPTSPRTARSGLAQ